MLAEYKSNNLSVNLLPSEVILERLHGAKITLIRNISIACLVLLIFLTSAAFTLRLSQKQKLEKSSQSLVYAEGKVSSLQDQEKNSLILAQRLAEIDKLYNLDSKQKELFSMIVKIMPVEIAPSQILVDKSGITAQLASHSLSAIDDFFTSLSEQLSKGKLKKVDLDGISYGKDGNFRFSLRIYSG